ncbi:MAG: hypothetical protein JXN59_16415 [Anaerolineae bacterium]|nr:hypothetical protein [Anaerolineae bacterium]
MAKKSKKAQQQKQQRRQAQKAAKRRQRQARRPAYTPPEESYNQPPPDLPTGSMDGVAESLILSEALADEPELADFLIDPIACANAWEEAAAEAGISPEELSQMSGEEYEDARMEIIAEVVRRVLDDDQRQQILDGLETMEVRFKRRRKLDKYMQTSLALIFLRADKEGQNWAVVGAVRALVERSMRLMGEILNVLGDDPEQALNDPEQSQELQAILENNPALSQVFETRLDENWKQGLNALYHGEWQFGLFSDEELEKGANIILKHAESIRGTAEIGEESSQMTEEIGQKLSTDLIACLADIATPARLEQMGDHLNALDHDPVSEQGLFINLLCSDLADEDERDSTLATLAQILLGELVHFVPGDDEEPEDE